MRPFLCALAAVALGACSSFTYPEPPAKTCTIAPDSSVTVEVKGDTTVTTQYWSMHCIARQ